MSCNCFIPDGAEVIARNTHWNKVVFRLNGLVYCALKPSVTPGKVNRRLAFIADHHDLFEPFEYDRERHCTIRRDLGDDPPTPEEYARIIAEIRARNLPVGDISYANVRGGKIIDFEIRPPHESSLRTARERKK